MFDSIHEECGVFGIFEKECADPASSAYFGLYALQHRGQESCGIAVCDDGVFRHKRADWSPRSSPVRSLTDSAKAIWLWDTSAIPLRADTTPIISSHLLSAISREIWHSSTTAISLMRRS